MSLDQWVSFWIMLHRILVIVDDWVCDHSPAAPLNRRAKGKYEN